jgi:hypothetical protein
LISFNSSQAYIQAREIEQSNRFAVGECSRKDYESVSGWLANPEMPTPIADGYFQIIRIPNGDCHAWHLDGA